MDEKEVLLPQTVEELDTFVKTLTAEFSLPDERGTYETIATMILHMDGTKCMVKPTYFVNAVKKARANTAAYTKMEEFRKLRAKEAKEEIEAENKAKLTLVPGESTEGVTQSV